MTSDVDTESDRIAVKLFVGCRLTPELKMSLGQSNAWSQARTVGQGDEELSELRFQDADYVGRFIAKTLPSLSDINDFKEGVLGKLATYCPDLEVARLKTYVFPQVFLS